MIFARYSVRREAFIRSHSSTSQLLGSTNALGKCQVVRYPWLTANADFGAVLCHVSLHSDANRRYQKINARNTTGVCDDCLECTTGNLGNDHGVGDNQS